MKDLIKYLLPIIFCFVLTVLILISNISSPALNLNYNFKNSIVSIFPQKWFFFTISGKKNILSCYKVYSRNNLIEVNYQYTSGSICGLNRLVRSKGATINSLFGIIPDSLWVSFPSNSVVNFDSINIFLVNKSLLKYLDTGSEYLLESKNKLPWIWSNTGNISVNIKLVRIKPI